MYSERRCAALLNWTLATVGSESETCFPPKQDIGAFLCSSLYVKKSIIFDKTVTSCIYFSWGGALEEWLATSSSFFLVWLQLKKQLIGFEIHRPIGNAFFSRLARWMSSESRVEIWAIQLSCKVKELMGSKRRTGKGGAFFFLFLQQHGETSQFLFKGCWKMYSATASWWIPFLGG